MITLRPVAITDLSVKFARKLDENKIRHYVVPASMSLITKFTGQTPKDLVREFIKRTENEDVEFEESEYEGVAFFASPFGGIPGSKMLGGLEVVDISQLVLGRDRKIGLELTKVQAHSMLHQYNYYKTPFHAFYDRLIWRYNTWVPKINRILYKLHGADYSAYNPFVRQLKQKDMIYQRKLEPVRFLAVAFEANDTEKALESFRSDLRILSKNKLIMGHLSMPSLMGLADSVGAGRFYTMFCFVITNTDRLCKLTGKTILELPRKPLELLGVKNEVHEGEVNWLDGKNPDNIFCVERVYVGGMTSDECHKMAVSQYNDQQELVKKIVPKARKDLQDWEKIESRTRDVGPVAVDGNYRRGVDVDVTLRNKKTGRVIRIDSEFRQNEGKITVKKEDNE